MTARRAIAGLALTGLAFGAVLLAGGTGEAQLNMLAVPAVVEPVQRGFGLPGMVGGGQEAPAAQGPPAAQEPLGRDSIGRDPMGRDPMNIQEPTGNPLWAIPLKSLNETRERPIFLPSRRPPAPVVVGVPIAMPVVLPPPPSVEPPPLNLVGAVSSSADSIAIFVDQSTRDVVRLKTGEGYAGWILRSVEGRDATLEKGSTIKTFSMPRLDESRR